MGVQIGPGFFERPQHACLDGIRMETVDEKHAGNEVVLDGFVECALAGRCLHDALDHALEGRAVQFYDGLHEFKRDGPQLRVTGTVEPRDQLLDAFGVDPELALFCNTRCCVYACRHHSCPATPNMGEWRVSKTFPLPRYMCTPQGKHGSKLRTARMMSMPLNLSGPFSSKMGVFCTASS